MRRRDFFRSGHRALRRIVGVAIAVIGVAVLFRLLPGWFWAVALGTGLVWAGWSVFAPDD